MEMRNSFGKRPVPAEYDVLENFPIFDRVLGILQPLKTSYGSIIERYSSQARDVVYLTCLPVPAGITGKANRYIMAGFCRSALQNQVSATGQHCLQKRYCLPSKKPMS
jgi:hypothetical protein